MPLGQRDTKRAYTAWEKDARREMWKYLRTSRFLFSQERAAIAAALGLSLFELGQYLDNLPASYTAGGQFWTHWQEAMTRRIGGTWASQAEAFSLSLGVSFDLWNPRTVAALRSNANRLATYIGTDTSRAVTEVLAEGTAQGWSMRQRTAAILEDVYDPSITTVRAKRIARTESIGSLNEGQHEAAKATEGVLELKSWLTQGDELVRESHSLNQAAGKILIDLAFPNGMMYPGDMSGPPGERINCRCAALYWPAA